MKNSHTKKEILAIAIDLFSSVGYKDCTMRELAKHVGIKPASLYYHYENKEQLINEIFDIFIKNDPKYRKQHDDLYPIALDKSVEEFLGALIVTYIDDDEFIEMIKVLRIAIGYQFENRRAKEAFSYIFYDMALRYRENIFATLINDGVYEPFDYRAVSYIITSYSMMLFMDNHSQPVIEFVETYNNGMATMIRTISPLVKKRENCAASISNCN